MSKRRLVLIATAALLVALNFVIFFGFRQREQLTLEFDLPLLVWEYPSGHENINPSFDAHNGVWVADGRPVRSFGTYMQDTGWEHGKVLFAGLPANSDLHTVRRAALSLARRGICRVIFVEAAPTSRPQVYPALWISRVRDEKSVLRQCVDRFNSQVIR
jgi:hypothetical protein